MREFSKDRYGVEVLKVEVPVNMKFVEGNKSFAGQKAYSKKKPLTCSTKRQPRRPSRLFICPRESAMPSFRKLSSWPANLA